MISLPSHIEKYLSEADFSATEILILRQIITGKAFTLRELASKTGKSTGVLDQAMKKLLKKQIAEKNSLMNPHDTSYDQ